MSETFGTISKVEAFVVEAICGARRRIRDAHKVRRCAIAGADPHGYICVIYIDGEEMVINITVKEREA